MHRFGLTGGIGSGKSTVAALFVELGAHLVDTDAIARQQTGPGGGALGPLSALFGADILLPTGALDRDRMRALVFDDASAKAQLEQVLHPLISAEAMRQAGLAGDRPVLFDVPLLTESRCWRGRVDRVVVVDCPEEEQVRRVMERSAWSEATVRGVIRSQAARPQRRAIADAVIDNGPSVPRGSLADTVRRLWMHWT